MKHIKILGLAVMAVLALSAIAASSASAATGTCTNDSKHQNGILCTAGHGQTVKAGSTFTVSLKAGTVAKLTATNKEGGSVATVQCTSSTVGGTDEGNGTGKITSLTFAGCSSAGCSTVTASTTASGAAPWVYHDEWISGTSGNINVTTVDGEFICTNFLGNFTCRYTAASAKGSVTGGTPATIKATNVSLAFAGGGAGEGFCGNKADWSGEYIVTTPTSLFMLNNPA